MSGISFGGLATGMDTNSLISELLKLEKRPLERLNTEKSYLNSRLNAFKGFNTKLKTLLSRLEGLDSSKEIRAYKATVGSGDFFSATAGSTARAGAYQIEVKNLAQLQKAVSGGYESQTEASFGIGEITLSAGGRQVVVAYDGNSLQEIAQKINDARLPQEERSQSYASATEASFGSGEITLTVDGVETALAYEGDSLEGIRDKINAAALGVSAFIIGDDTDGYRLTIISDKPSTSFRFSVEETEAGSYGPLALTTETEANSPLGVSAAIINDGVTGYRVVLTGENASEAFTATISESTSGSYAPLAFATTQAAKEATILVDGVEVRNGNNSFDSAIPGVTLNLLKPSETGVATSLSVATDMGAVKKKVEDFVSAYNDVIRFIGQQAGSGWAKDTGFRFVKGNLQDFLVEGIETTGKIRTLAELGIETNKDGTLSLDSAVLAGAVQNDLDSLEKLLMGETSGETEVEGIVARLKGYLEEVTNAENGLLASKEKGSQQSIRKIDESITRTEARLEQREKTLRAQFEALEQLVSLMNSQSNYLSQQMTMLSNLWSRKQ